MPPLKKGAEVEIQIESLAYGAEGVGRVDGYVVFVERGLPGQRVKARILRAKKSHTRAKILQVLEQSPDYVPPICRHFPDCGGCSIQHLQYDKQLEAKTTQVRDILQRLGGFENPPVAPALPSPKPFFYRNKMEFTFGDRRWLTRNEIESQAEFANTDFALGLHARHHFEKVIAIEQCYLQSEQSNAILNRVSKFVAASPLRPYTTRDHSGFWRFLVIREGKNTGDCMVNLVTADAGSTGEEEVQKLATELRLHFPELTTIVHTINRLKAQVATGQESRVLHGLGF
ncbi:MAG: class I SAM-dependent RNA methyltransferase, partial [Calditrichaeota bacterium]